MSILVDGNNLLHALSSAGSYLERQGLVSLLSRTFSGKRKIHVVYDGTGPVGPLAEHIGAEGVTVTFSGKRPADDVIIDLIAKDTGPRELTVVSTDHQIRRAAHRRRCHILLSEEFARMLLNAAKPQPKKPADGAEKPDHLSPDQVERWLDEFGLK